MPEFDVTVEIDSFELHEAGYHHDDECDVETTVEQRVKDALNARGHDTIRSDYELLIDTINELHRLLHEDQPLDAARCLHEPCRTAFDRELKIPDVVA